MTDYWYDTEFWERGPGFPIIPISLGIWSDDGRWMYLINGQAPLEEIWPNQWMRDNVLMQLPIAVYPDQKDEAGVPRLGWNEESHAYERSVFTTSQWAARLEEFLGFGHQPITLWADWSAYDHVVFAQLWGTMMDLPPWMPQRTHCTQQLIDDRGLREQWKAEAPSVRASFEAADFVHGREHNALVDAFWTRRVWTWATERVSTPA